MTDEEYVKSIHPEARCSDYPIDCFWPGQGEYSAYLVLSWGGSSISIGQGKTKEEAWAKAAARVKADQQDINQ